MDPWCGMEQNQIDNDMYDWTRQTGPTDSRVQNQNHPAGVTGPSTGMNSFYYIYAEASSPRQSGDIAR